MSVKNHTDSSSIARSLPSLYSSHLGVNIMKSRNLLLTATIAGAIASTTAFAAPSAKFAATYTTKAIVSPVAEITNATMDTIVPVDWNTATTLATIKVPQSKELLVGVSAEIGLVTLTSVSGKKGGGAKSIAGASARVDIFAERIGGGASYHAEPGQIMLSGRVQELNATLGGVIQSCEDTTGTVDDFGVSPGDVGYLDTPDGKIDIASECIVTDEEIGLLLDTTAAHHFNFVLPNMDQGEYEIQAVFTTGARAEIEICDADADDACAYDPQGTVSASSTAKAIVNKTMVTVQQVRAAKGGIIDATITEYSQLNPDY
jgi:hypothetical protein